jgi:DNA helicase II / ATP-dependent DNA helicase PcrA
MVAMVVAWAAQRRQEHRTGGGNSSGGGSYTGFKQESNRYGYKDEKAAEYGREGAPDTSRANFETRRGGEYPFAIGQTVSHAKFGEGVVLAFEGRGNDARVQVKFRSEGVKWLAMQYAKLTAVA